MSEPFSFSLTGSHGHEWGDVLKGVHRLDGLAPVTEHKQYDDRETERLMWQIKDQVMCTKQTGTFLGHYLHDCCWYQIEPIGEKKQQQQQHMTDTLLCIYYTLEAG